MRSQSGDRYQILTALAFIPAGFTLRVGVNPYLREIGHELFRILASFESVGQAANGVRVTLPIARPGDLGSWAPGFGALIYGCVGNNESIVVIEISHRGKNYMHVMPSLPIISGASQLGPGYARSITRRMLIFRRSYCQFFGMR
jgi:hypothetical protein